MPIGDRLWPREHNRQLGSRGWAPAPVRWGAAALLALLSLAAQAQLIATPRLGSASRGAQVFARCQRCHSLAPGINGTGPTLHGLFGRRAGSAPGFAYSPALRRSRVLWNEDTLSEYLAGTKSRARRRMPGHAVADPGELGDLLAYLEEATR